MTSEIVTICDAIGVVARVCISGKGCKKGDGAEGEGVFHWSISLVMLWAYRQNDVQMRNCSHLVEWCFKAPPIDRVRHVESSGHNTSSHHGVLESVTHVPGTHKTM